MARYAPAALVAALLVATGLAFAHTESLKLTPSPILGTQVTKVFSPVCRCETDRAEIAFRLRNPDSLEVEIIDARGRVVRRLVTNRRYPRGPVLLTWRGRDPAGLVVPEGVYKPRVRLLKQHRTIVLPNPILVDTTPPVISLVTLGPRTFSPDADKRKDRVVVRYRVDEPARVMLLVDGEPAARKRGTRTTGQIDWYGRLQNRLLPTGPYELQLEAVDLAGNAGKRTPPKEVVLRYVALGRKQISVAAGGRFAILVLSDAARIAWKLGSRTGTSRPGTLRLRAPLQPGFFTLTVTANGRAVRAAVVVRRAG